MVAALSPDDVFASQRLDIELLGQRHDREGLS